MIDRRPPSALLGSVLPLLMIPLGVALLAVPSAARGGPGGGPGGSQSLESCAARKLEAAATYCRAALRAETLGGSGPFGAYQRDRVLHAYGRRLERDWARIDATPLESGRACAESTSDEAPVSALVEDEAQALAEGAEASPPAGVPGRLGAWLGEIRREQELRAAGKLCTSLLAAEAEHLRHRFEDRTREGLEADRERALRRFERRAGSLGRLFGGDEGAGTEATAEAVRELVAEVVGTVAVSPQVSPEWEMIEPAEVVDYRGEELRPTCWDGDPWVFFARKGSVNKLLMYYQGGGACWNGLTCGGVEGLVGPTFKTSTGPGDSPEGAGSGFADLEDPDNPFGDWNAVFVPYCTGDVHWGDAVVDHPRPDGSTITVRHKGFVNAQVAEKFAREHFVHPEQVFVTGSSAGAYGAIVNSLYLQENTFPSADFAVVGDGGNGVITQDFLANDLSKWGIEENLPAWMPGLNVSLTELRASDLYVEAAETYPWNRFATYTTAYDGGTGGQTGFFQIMRSGDNVLQYPLWWNSSCLWNERMLELNEETASGAENFRYYVGTGSAHTMWGRDKVYSDTTGGVPTVRDWIVAMLEEGPGWTNVVAEDFGVLLPGDPRPDPDGPFGSPPFDPFDLEAERIVCEE